MNSSIIVLDDSIFFLKSILSYGVDLGFYSLETDMLLYSIQSEQREGVEDLVYFFVKYPPTEDLAFDDMDALCIDTVDFDDLDIREYDSIKELLYEEDEFEKDLLDNKFGIRSLSGY